LVLYGAAAECGFFVAYPNIKEGVLAVVFVIGGLVSVATTPPPTSGCRDIRTPTRQCGNTVEADEGEEQQRNDDRDDS